MQDFLKEIVNDSKDVRSKSNSPTSPGSEDCIETSPTVIRIKTHTPGLRPPITVSTNELSPLLFLTRVQVFIWCAQIEEGLFSSLAFSVSQLCCVWPPLDSMRSGPGCNVCTSSFKQAGLCLLQGRTSPPTTARANRPLQRRPARCPALPTAWSGPGPPGRRVPTAVPPRPWRAARAARGPCWRSLGKVRPRTLKFLSIFFLFVFAAWMHIYFVHCSLLQVLPHMAPS